mmetsp:Transcript_74365/g.123301  ORF Transcript_74365/g.123301 Transcript_74365/m.123301 type:complete len:370 (+) Transcript_74365:69-1178(+)
MGDEDARTLEMEALGSMYADEEMTFHDVFRFTIKLLVDDPEGQVGVEVACTLPDGYPEVNASFSLTCDRISRKQSDQMLECLIAELPEENQVLFALDWIRDNATSYFCLTEQASPKKASESKTVKGFMREWCSFVGLYKGYGAAHSGVDRFQFITDLACGRGLNITGMGIAGKPGGLVVEGEEADVVEFMRLMRTEFFQHVSTHSKKLTTRLQERWPLDVENEKFEAAEVMDRIRKDAYRTADRADESKKFKAGERERLEQQEAGDKARLQAWKDANKNQELTDAEVDALVAAGPPAKCTTKGIYFKCGCEEPPTLEEVNSRRCFQDFTILPNLEEGHALPPDLRTFSKLCKDRGLTTGFHETFDYRFS